MPDTSYLGLMRIDKRTGETWKVIRLEPSLHLRNDKTGKVRDRVTLYHFDKWYITRERYEKIIEAKNR